MRIGFIADVHVGNMNRFGRGTAKAGINRRARMTLDVLSEVFKSDPARDCEAIYIAGDLLDSVRMEPQLIAATQEAIYGSDWIAQAVTRVRIIVGNHEQASEEPGDHSVGAVGGAVCKVIERPEVVQEDSKSNYQDAVDVYAIPFDPSKRGADLIESAIAEIELTRDEDENGQRPLDLDLCPRVIVAHLGVEDSSTPVWLRGAHDSIKATELYSLMKRANIRTAIVGNWHNHRVWRFEDGRQIVQCGALVPTGFSNPSTVEQLRGRDEDPYGSLIVWDTEEPARITRHVFDGPRFIKTRNVDEATEALDESDRAFVELSVSPDAVSQARDALAERLTGWEEARTRLEIVADTRDVAKRIESAAISARESDTAERAVSEYVLNMPLDEDLERAEVLRVVRRLVAGAGSG